MEKILSIMIPSYNVESCLKRCLGSLILSEKEREKLEVLVIDDGSSDGTFQIAKAFEEEYPACFRVIRKENGGHGSVLNRGALEAQGKYLKALDADDWMLTENLASFLSFLETASADVILTPYHMVDKKTGSREEWQMNTDSFGEKITLKEVTENWYDYSRCTTYHGITYRTAFYREKGYKLTENAFYEDHEYAAIPFCFAQSVCPLNLFLYQYQVGNESQSIADENRVKHVEDSEKVTKALLSAWNSFTGLDSYQREYLFRKLEGVVMAHVTTLCLLKKERGEGRKQAYAYAEMLKRTAPDVSARMEKKIRVFLLFNRLGLSKRTFDRIMGSRLYKKIKGKGA